MHRYPCVEPVQPPMLPFHPDNLRISNLESSFHRSVVAPAPIFSYPFSPPSPTYPPTFYSCLEMVPSTLLRSVVWFRRKRRWRRDECNAKSTKRSPNLAEISVNVSNRPIINCRYLPYPSYSLEISLVGTDPENEQNDAWSLPSVSF